MKHKLKLYLLGLLSITILAISGSSALAFNPLAPACQTKSGAGASGPVCTQNKAQNGSPVNPALHTINVASTIIAFVAGIAAVIVIIVSGFQFITAGGIAGGQRAGDAPGGAKKARQTLVGAVIGLLVIALAWTLITVVTNLLA